MILCISVVSVVTSISFLIYLSFFLDEFGLKVYLFYCLK